MTSDQQHAQWLYDWCLLLERERIPYNFAAGHGPIKPVDGPYGEWLPPTLGKTPDTGPGYDCGSYAYSCLWRAGLAGDQFKEVPGTTQLEDWALSGVGRYVTLRVFDGLLPVLNGFWIEHCFLQVTGLGPERPDALFAAQYPGTICGKFTASPEWVDAFHARHSEV